MIKLSFPTVCLGVCLGLAASVAPANAQGATVISVPAGGDLQKAINAALPGDTIQLQPGATYEGNFELPVKAGSTFITIRTAPDVRQPAPGVRVQPSHAPALARLISRTTQAALRTRGAAHHYRLMLLEFGPNSLGMGDIIQLGHADAQQTTLDQVPYELVLDRLYIHGDPASGQKRGIALNSGSTQIINCYISEIKALGQDTQAIDAMNGPGPYLIENNYLEAAGENFMAGGVDPQIPNLVPSNITFRYNYFYKPVSWRNPIVPTPTRVAAVAADGVMPAGTYAYRVVAERGVASGTTARSAASVEVSVTLAQPGSVTVTWAPVERADSYRVYGRLPGSATGYWTTTSTQFIDNGGAATAGTPAAANTWTVKNLFELKNARHVIVERNVMENHWKEAQPGYAIVITPRNSGGLCTWCLVEDATFRANLLRHTGAAVNVLGYDNTKPFGQSGVARGVTFVDNLFYDVNTSWGGTGWLVQLGDGPADFVFDHNTFDHNGSTAFYAYGSMTMPGVRITNNLMRHNQYGIFGQGVTYGSTTIAKYFPDGTVTNNVLAGGYASKYPAGNLFPTVATHDAQFTAPAVGDYSLVPGSIYARAGLDGADLGANVKEVMAAADMAIRGAPATTAVQIPDGQLPRATVGTPMDAVLTATGGSGQYKWSLAGTLPTGVQFNGSTATLSGVPAEYGTWSVQVTAVDASDPGNAATRSIAFEVWPMPVRITGASLPVGIAGRAARGAVYADGGTRTYRWRVVSGALPGGMVLDASTGTLSGIPSLPGTFNFGVEVADTTYPLVAQGAFSMTIVAPVAVLTSTLPAGVQGLSYDAVLEASGGASALQWKLSSGQLPAGLSLSGDGHISSTPTATGTSTFSVTASDSVDPSNASSATLTISVQCGDIVLHARRATTLAGTWKVISDSTAAGGARVGQLDAALPKVTTPSASPVHYFELPFTAVAGRAYHLWIRGKAQNNSWANDSVYVQFSGSVTATGTPIARIGTTSALRVNLEDDANVGVSGWGWQDDGYGLNVLGSPIYFDGTPQRVRIQTREDGFSIDQVVLSPFNYATKAPGTLKNDTTILPEAGHENVAAAADLMEVVVHAASATTLSGTFHMIPDATAADGIAVGTSDAGVPKVSAQAAPVNFVEFTFQAQANTPYRLWMRGNAQNDSWANDSVHVQFSSSVDAAGTPIYRIGTTSAAWVNLEDALDAGVQGWGWQDNGWGTNVLGPLVYFATTGMHTIRVQVREDGYRFDQIVLSSQKYVAVAPGALKNDTTILP